LLSQAYPSWATPTEINSNLYHNDTNSAVLGDDADPQRLWVLPPTQGVERPLAVSSSASLPICQSIADTYKSVRAAETQSLDLSSQHISAIEAIDQNSPSAAAQIAALEAKYGALDKVIADEQKKIDEFYSKWGTQDGGSAQGDYATNWSSNVDRIRAENPTFNVEPVETKALFLYFTIPGASASTVDLSGMPIFKSFSAQGGIQGSASSAVMSDKLAVNYTLSMLGACLLSYGRLFGTALDPTFAMAAAYQYPRAYKFHISATYNIWQIYKYFTESGSSGGFFSSHSWSDTTEQNWGDSAFTINWRDEDPNNQISTDDKLNITKTIKEELLVDLASLAAVKVGRGLELAGKPGPDGAKVLSDGLMKTCGANAYCLGAAVALQALDAIFGKSSSSSSYVKQLNVTATYNFDSSTTRYAQAGTNFAGDQQ